MKLGISKKVDAVRAIPDQIRWTLILASTALIVAMIAVVISMDGGRRAN